MTPADVGLAFEPTTIPCDGFDLPAWFIPARGGAPGPAVVLVHGWESARDRTLPIALFLNAAGFHCLAFDVRAHGDNPAEDLPLSAGEFGADTLAAFRAALERPEVTAAAISGHSMGGIGAILAAGADPRVAAVVASSTPAGPYRLTRQTFRLARLPIPDLIAYPLAWLTTRVYLRPRGHDVESVSATSAIARYAGPVLLAHGDLDSVVPQSHMARLAAAALAGREGRRDAAPVETLVVAGGQHSWLYEDRGYRRVVARFLATALGGPLDPEEAGERAAATPAQRIPEGEAKFAAMEETYGGLRALAQIALPGATKRIAQPPDEIPAGAGVERARPSDANPEQEASPLAPIGATDPLTSPIPTPPAL